VRARALAVAGSSLKAESVPLAASASQYQAVGQVSQANHIMVMAHALFHQGELMNQQAKRLQAAALDVNDALPRYQRAEQAAVNSAAAAASAADSAATPTRSFLPY